MDPHRLAQLGVAAAVLLLALTAYVAWFDFAALTAVFYPTHDAAGNLRFQVPGYTNTVYPFTYAAVAASFAGVSYSIFVQERSRLPRGLALVLALLVANLASIGTVDCYEQVFVTMMFLSPGLHSSGVYGYQLYWSTAGTSAATAGGLLLALAVLPWAKRPNWPGVMLCLGVTGAAVAVWFLAGFSESSGGSALAYGMNATSRIASQLALVAAVAPLDWVRGVARAIHRSAPRLRAREVPSSASEFSFSRP